MLSFQIIKLIYPQYKTHQYNVNTCDNTRNFLVLEYSFCHNHQWTFFLSLANLAMWPRSYQKSCYYDQAHSHQSTLRSLFQMSATFWRYSPDSQSQRQEPGNLVNTHISVVPCSRAVGLFSTAFSTTTSCVGQRGSRRYLLSRLRSRSARRSTAKSRGWVVLRRRAGSSRRFLMVMSSRSFSSCSQYCKSSRTESGFGLVQPWRRNNKTVRLGGSDGYSHFFFPNTNHPN